MNFIGINGLNFIGISGNGLNFIGICGYYIDFNFDLIAVLTALTTIEKDSFPRGHKSVWKAWKFVVIGVFIQFKLSVSKKAVIIATTQTLTT